MVMYLKLRIFLILFFKLIFHNIEEDQHNTLIEHMVVIEDSKIMRNKIITCNFWFYFQFYWCYFFLFFLHNLILIYNIILCLKIINFNINNLHKDIIYHFLLLEIIMIYHIIKKDIYNNRLNLNIKRKWQIFVIKKPWYIKIKEIKMYIKVHNVRNI